MKRKKYMLGRYKNYNERMDAASLLITNLTIKLREGWSPYVDSMRSRGFMKIEKIIEDYRKYILALTRKNSIKQKTSYDYLSRLAILEEYVKDRRKSIKYVYQFDQIFVTEFLDYVFLDRDASARTRNNYRTWLSSFSSWLIEKKYIESNPVSDIKQLPEDQKYREAIPARQLQKLQTYLSANNKSFLLACMMEYYTFIRPTELVHITLGDININDQKIFVSSSISKNRRDGMVALNDRIIKLMIQLNVFSYPSQCYLFGPNMTPSEQMADSRIFRDLFNKVRANINYPSKYQFYSLKDSGIRDLANAEGIVVARDQARHTDISTTNKYLVGQQMAVNEETKHFEGNL
jgi:integrase